MNFLAHAYLSGTNENIIIGNFIADHVKGKAIGQYSEQIRAGIILHRHIDAFTDSHPVVRKSTGRLKNEFGKYSGVIVDMYYDHFLAKNWNVYSCIPLRKFTSGIYNIMMRHFAILPPKTRRILPFMVESDWLAGYAQLQGLHQALAGMARRAKYASGMEFATEALMKDYVPFRNDFLIFFDDLRRETGGFILKNGL